MTRVSLVTMARPLAAVLVLSLAAAGCGNGSTDDATRPTPVRVAPVETAPLDPAIRAVGLLATADEVRLSFKAGGVVAAIHVEQGARLSKGQLLATLRQDEVDAAVAQARALADKSDRDLERGRALLADEVATLEQLENLVTARDVAHAALRAAAFNARFSRIEAPGDGILLRRLAEPGELVAAGQPVLVAGLTGGGWIVRASLADRDIVRIAPGTRAAISVDAFPGRRFAGAVTELASASDPMSGTYEVQLAVDPQGAHFLSGMVAKVEFDLATAVAVPVLPVSALLEADGSVAVVYVIAPGEDVARRVAVRIGRLVGERVEVLGGLEGGEQVVTEGAAYLRDGELVRVIGAG